MVNIKKILTTVVFIMATIIIAITIYNYSSSDNLELHAISHSPVDIQQGDKLFFYEGGFAVAGEYTSFFDNTGQQTTFPYGLDEEDQNFNITDITSNFVLANGNTIYKIEDMNLSKVYVLESPAIGMEEYDKYLLLSVEDQEKNIDLKFLDLENEIFSDLGFDDSFYYMDADIDTSDSSLSVLALDISGSFPSSKILHYDKNLSLYGVTSSTDRVFYKVFKFPSITILIGNRELVCYNIEGNVEWKIENNNMDGFQSVHNDLGLLIYFGQTIKENGQADGYNGIFFNNNGDKQDINLPPQLSKIFPYKNKFLGLQYGKNILVINKDGKVEQQYSIDDDIKEIYWNPCQPNSFYIIKQDNTLQIYSVTQEDY